MGLASFVRAFYGNFLLFEINRNGVFICLRNEKPKPIKLQNQNHIAYRMCISRLFSIGTIHRIRSHLIRTKMQTPWDYNAVIIIKHIYFRHRNSFTLSLYLCCNKSWNAWFIFPHENDNASQNAFLIAYNIKKNGIQLHWVMCLLLSIWAELLWYSPWPLHTLILYFNFVIKIFSHNFLVYVFHWVSTSLLNVDRLHLEGDILAIKMLTIRLKIVSIQITIHK